MRSRVSKRASMLLALMALTVFIAGGTGARADHGPDSPLYIQQAGNGSSSSTPVIRDFNMHTVLYDAKSFPLSNGYPRPGGSRYIAWGTIPIPSPQNLLLAQVAFTKSNNGLTWSDPVAITIKDDSTGTDVPLIVNDPTFQMDVEFGSFPVISANGSPELQFALYYHDGDSTTSVDSLHVALSLSGDTFTDDQPLTSTSQSVQDQSFPPPAPRTAAAKPLLDACGAGSTKCGTYGPTDVIYQAGGISDVANCGNAATPWACRYVMIYNTFDAAGREHASIAGSGDARNFYAFGSPILSPGAAGAWDDEAATLAHVRKLSSTSYTMVYSGGRLPDNACSAGNAGCWSLGTATSTDGLTFTKSPANPATPSTLLNNVNPDVDPVVSPANATPANISTLWNANALNIGKVGHLPVYFTRITGGSSASNAVHRDVFMGYSAPAPGRCDDGLTLGCPDVRFAFPDDFQNVDTAPLEIYLGDSLGTNIGIDYATLALTIDAAPLEGAVAESTIINQYYYTGYKVTVRRDLLGHLSDGVHTVTATVRDFDGMSRTRSMTFVTDTTPPVTTKAPGSDPTGPVVVMPLGSLGTFIGQTVDGGAGLKQLRVIVTNVVGLTKTFDLFPKPDGTGPITVVNANTWKYRWVAPTLDPLLSAPGIYTVSVIGIDKAVGIEKPSPTNTVQLIVI
jgi:hypothetical protein